MASWKNNEELFALIREKLYTPVVGDILDQMGRSLTFNQRLRGDATLIVSG